MSGVFIDSAGNPSWNLSAETVCYPLTIKSNGKAFRVYFELKIPNNGTVKTALRKAIPSQKVTGNEIQSQPGDLSQARTMVSDLFVRMYGVNIDDPEEHRKYLDARPDLKERVFTEGLLGVARWREPAGGNAQQVEAENDLFSITIPSEQQIKTFKGMYCPDSGKEYEIQMNHRMHTPTGEDILSLNKLNKMYANPVKHTIYSVADLSLVEKLYQKLVISLEGYTIDGGSCEESTREDWMDAVPLAHKYMAVQLLFEEVELKN